MLLDTAARGRLRARARRSGVDDPGLAQTTRKAPTRAVTETALEATLASQARAGDESAFAALVRLHQHRMYAVALRMTGDPRDAEDVVQDAFLHVWRGLPRFRGDAQFGTWVTRVVINRCHNLRRDTKPTVPLTDEVPSPHAPGADTVVEAARLREATMAAIAELPFDQRAALVLHTFAGYSHAEAGRILGVSETAAKVRVHRARRALAQRLREWR